MHHDLSKAIKAGAEIKHQSRFDSTMSSMITSAVDAFAVPWLIKCLKKYSEADFHTRLSGQFCSIHNAVHPQGMTSSECMPFSFILDFHLNHKLGYTWFLKTLKYLHKWYEINVDTIYANLTEYLTKEWGWTLLPHELTQIHKELGQIRNMIYHGSYDS